MKKSMIFLFLSLILLTSCSVGTSSSRQEMSPQPAQLSSTTENSASTDTEKPSVIPTNTLLPTNTELPTQTPLPTIAPTQTPTKTELVPALNKTLMPVISQPFEKNNLKDVRVLKQSSSTDNIVLLGMDGSRWFVQKDISGEFYDTKTNKILWVAKDATYFKIEPTGSMAINFKNNFSEFEVQHQDQASEIYKMIPFEGKEDTYFFTAFSKRLMIIEPRPPWWYLEGGRQIDVFSWGDSKPKYSVKGNMTRITTGEKYLTYLQGKNLVFANLETGEKVTEFTLTEVEINLLAYGEKQFWNTSWDDSSLAISRNGSLEIWTLPDHKLVRTIQIQKDTVLDDAKFVFSPSGKLVMVLMPDGFIRTWSVESGEKILEEETTDSTLSHKRVTDQGEIISFQLPEVPGRSWRSDFSSGSYLTFIGEKEELIFTNQLLNNYRGATDLCDWQLSSTPECNSWEDEIWAAPVNYQLFGIGDDNERYYLKSKASPVSLHKGWEKDGEFVAKLPSLSSKGYIYDFKYIPEHGILQVKYSDGKLFILNHKTNSRLLLNGVTDDRLVISPDGSSLLGILNTKSEPPILEFARFDVNTLKEISRIPLTKTVHPLAVDKSVADLTPRVPSLVLSPDGKYLYAYINYISLTEKDQRPNAKFLVIPMDSVDAYDVIDLELPSGGTSNLVVTNSGDLAIIGQAQSGDLVFLDTSSGELVNVIHLGGNPIKLALRPDNTLLAVADEKLGISILGIPGD